MDKKDVQVLINKRIAAEVFNMEHPCDYCNRFVNQTVELSAPCISTQCGNGIIKICKGCLQELIDILDKNMQKNFQSDFEKTRNVLTVDEQGEKPWLERFKLEHFVDQTFNTNG